MPQPAWRRGFRPADGLISTIPEADKVVVMDLGRIVEVGTRDELMACGGLYYNLSTMQWTGQGDLAADGASNPMAIRLVSRGRWSAVRRLCTAALIHAQVTRNNWGHRGRIHHRSPARCRSSCDRRGNCRHPETGARCRILRLAIPARNRAAAGIPVSGAGGFLDICADFVVYGSTVLGVAVGTSQGFDAPTWPFMFVLLAYYVDGASLLAFSSIAEKAGRPLDDGRSLSFVTSFAGSTETILVHTLWLLFPASAWVLALVWTGIVMADAVRQVVTGYRLLS